MGDIYLIKDLARTRGFSIYTIKYYIKLKLVREAGRFPELKGVVNNELLYSYRVAEGAFFY